MNSKIEKIVSEGYRFDSTRYMREGWELYKENFISFVAFAILTSLISLILQFIPLIGGLAAAVISPCFIAGYFLVADKIRNREAYSFSNFFDGFQHLGQLFVTVLLIGLIFVGLIIGFIIVGVILYFALKDSESVGGFNTQLIVVGILFYVVFIVVIAYLSVSFSFANQFVLFEKLEAWQAIQASRKVVNKNFWQVFGFYILMGLVVLVPFLVVLGLGYSTILEFFITFKDSITSGASDPMFIYKSLGLLLVPILLISALVTPWIQCSIHAAFRDVMKMDEDEATNYTDISKHLLDE